MKVIYKTTAILPPLELGGPLDEAAVSAEWSMIRLLTGIGVIDQWKPVEHKHIAIDGDTANKIFSHRDHFPDDQMKN